MLVPPVTPTHDHVRGDPDALVELVEFGDYECPHCGRAHAIVGSLRQSLGERLSVVYRHFPLTSVHPHAFLAAEAAEAAGAQGRFWEMHDLLLENQQNLEPGAIEEHAEGLGLRMEAFVSDLQSHRFDKRIHADLRSGALSGVNGTPTFFINGERHEGTYELDSLFEAISRALLAQAARPPA